MLHSMFVAGGRIWTLMVILKHDSRENTWCQISFYLKSGGHVAYPGNLVFCISSSSFTFEQKVQLIIMVFRSDEPLILGNKLFTHRVLRYVAPIKHDLATHLRSRLLLC